MAELSMTTVTNQPHGQVNGIRYPLDPVSLEVVNRIPAMHKSSKTLSNELSRTMDDMSQNLENLRSVLHGNISYEQFMADMLYRDEVVLANQQFIQYDYVTFEMLPSTGTPTLPVKKNLTRGRAFLTNRRLIMLSNEGTQGTQVAGVPPETFKPTKYSVKCEAGDAFHYQYLPLNTIRAVEFDAIIGASMTAYIDSDEACCLCQLFSCCGGAVCLRSWQEVGRAENPAINLRILKMSVDLPPWGNPCVVSIYIQPHVNMLLVKDVLRDLQAYGPAMRIQAYERTF